MWLPNRYGLPGGQSLSLQKPRMAIPRKDALKRLAGLAKQVELHLAILAANPGDPSRAHHESELRNWMRSMEDVLQHVGIKTAAQWQTRIKAYKANLGD